MATHLRSHKRKIVPLPIHRILRSVENAVVDKMRENLAFLQHVRSCLTRNPLFYCATHLYKISAADLEITSVFESFSVNLKL